jgi:hypothetical protein
MKRKANGARKPFLEATIPCLVSLGMFRDERGVRVRLPDGRELSVIVDRRSVIVETDPEPGKEVQGKLKVAVVAVKDDRALVDLPQASFTSGPRLELPRAALQPIPA